MKIQTNSARYQGVKAYENINPYYDGRQTMKIDEVRRARCRSRHSSGLHNC
jgi:hypothetical protein